jgi:hypothetical protein
MIKIGPLLKLGKILIIGVQPNLNIVIFWTEINS